MPNAVDRKRLRYFGYGLLGVSSLCGIVGGVSSQLVSWDEEPGWRWLTWAGLVAFTATAVVSWWLNPPPPLAPPTSSGQRPTDTLTDAGAKTSTTSGGKERGTRVTRFLSKYAEPVFTWLVAYPLFPAVFLFFWLVSWGGLGDGLGFPDLMWYETWWQRFWVGVAVSLLFLCLLFVRYLLDDRPQSSPPAFFGEDWSLFRFVRDDAPPIDPDVPETGEVERAREIDRKGKAKVRRLGAFLLWLWPGTLAVFYVPKTFAPVWCELGQAGAMFFGLSVAVIGFVVLVWVYNKWLQNLWQDNRFFRNLPGFATKQIPEEDRLMHGLAGVLAAVVIAPVVLFAVEHVLYGVVWSPVWLLCIFLGLFTIVYGFVTFHLAGLQYVLFGLGLLVVVVCGTRFPQRMTFPGLEQYDSKALRVNPDDPGGTARDQWKAGYDSLGLIESNELLETFHSKWAKAAGPAERPRQKPRLVIVATTGGGIQAAVWTAVVLEGLERKLSAQATGGAAFRDHIRLITGASGGMQAAGLYAADFETFPKLPTPDLLSTQLARDSLWPTVQTMLLHDLPGVAVPWRFASDRGRTLEDAWEFNTAHWGTADGRPADPPDIYSRHKAKPESLSPLRRSFAALREKEAACERPSLVFSPMLIEDCRRLVISNLTMDWFTTADGSNLNSQMPGIAEQPAVPAERLAVPAVEFWRLFPDAYHGNPATDGRKPTPAFKVGTAARMSATFPFVGPAVSLPTEPVRRVVDAGYFDNFGINLAALWLYRHKAAIREHTSGVVIVEIRAYPRRNEKLRFNTQAAGKEELVGWATSELSSPAEAILNLYSRGAYFRNDQLLDVLDKEFNRAAPPSEWAGGAAVVGGVALAPEVVVPAEKRFFTTVAFECNQPAALSWTLPSRDLRTIRQRFADDDGNLHGDVSQQIERLHTWFGVGGTR